MEPNKVRIQELTLLYGAVNGLVDLSHLDAEDGVVIPNLGAIFAEHLVGLKMKPFTGMSQKTETVGSLLTPIFMHLGIRLDEGTAVITRRFLDEAHLLHSGWLKDNLFWTVKSLKYTDCALIETWDDYDTLFYNAWLDVAIEPTRFIDQATVKRLGIESDLTDMIGQLGFGSMATHPYKLHVSMVRQFMATAQLTYRNSRARVAGDGTLSFFARGIRYSISITELYKATGSQTPLPLPASSLTSLDYRSSGRHLVQVRGAPVQPPRWTFVTPPCATS
ncbi:hypothetical protein Bca101_010027 [Brassica carinata]